MIFVFIFSFRTMGGHWAIQFIVLISAIDGRIAKFLGPDGDSPFAIYFIYYSTFNREIYRLVFFTNAQLIFLRHLGLDCVGRTFGPRRTAY